MAAMLSAALVSVVYREWSEVAMIVLAAAATVGIGLALRKETLRRRGAIRSAAVRRPGPRLSEQDVGELDRLLARLERKTGRLIAERVPLGS